MSKKRTLTRTIFVIVAVALAMFLMSGCGNEQEQETSTQVSETKTTVEQTTTQAPERQSLKILLPVSKYKDIEKFTAAYNADDNKYTIDLVLIESLDGIDPFDYDGLIIPGGKHVHPSFYGAEVECTKHKFNPELDELELNLVDMFVEAGKPIMGVCRGCQLVNVALGGTLKQDIGMEHYDDAVRDTTIMEGTDFSSIFGDSVDTVHFHHQAVDALAEGLTVTMVDAEDGTIEGYIHDTLPIYAVQFHPDRMYVKEDPEIKKTGRIFMDYYFDICQSKKQQSSDN